MSAPAENGLAVQPYRLGSNENPLGTSPKARAAIAQAAAGLWQYPPRDDEHMRQCLADHHELKASQIILGNSGSDVLSLVARVHLDASSTCIICPPAFPVYAGTAAQQGAEVISVPLAADTFALEPDAIHEVLTPSTKVLYLCNPNNPTGTLIPKDTLLPFLKALPDDLTIVYDEVYYHFVDPAKHTPIHDVLNAHPNAIIVHSFSKAYGLAGLRLGYALANEDAANTLRAHTLTFQVGSLALLAGEAALSDTEHIQATLANNRQERPKLARALTDLGLHVWESETNFVLFACPKDDAGNIYEGNLLASKFYEQGFIVRPAFGLPEHMRVTVGLPKMNRAFIQALAAILEGN